MKKKENKEEKQNTSDTSQDSKEFLDQQHKTFNILTLLKGEITVTYIIYRISNRMTQISKAVCTLSRFRLQTFMSNYLFVFVCLFVKYCQDLLTNRY